MLLCQGADPHQAPSRGPLPITCAAMAGNENAVRKLQDAGADVATSGVGTSWGPLVWAVLMGHVGCVRTLLEAGWKLESTGSNEWGPLLWAAATGQAACVRMLLQSCVGTESGHAGE